MTNNIFYTYDDNNKLTHVTYYFVNNEKQTVPVDTLSAEMIELLETMKRENSNHARYERHRKTQCLHDFDNYIETNAPHLDDVIIRFETHKYFHECLNTLPKHQRDLIYEIHFLNVPVKQIALRENVDPSAISHRYTRAKTELKRQLLRYDRAFADCDFDFAA